MVGNIGSGIGLSTLVFQLTIAFLVGISNKLVRAIADMITANYVFPPTVVFEDPVPGTQDFCLLFAFGDISHIVEQGITAASFSE